MRRTANRPGSAIPPGAGPAAPRRPARPARPSSRLGWWPRFDVEHVVREQTAGNAGDRGSEPEGADLSRGRIDSDERGGGFIVVHRAKLEPEPGTLERHHDDEDSSRPDPDIADPDELHAMKAGRTSHRLEVDEEAAHHLAEAERRHREIDALEAECRKSDHDTNGAAHKCGGDECG